MESHMEGIVDDEDPFEQMSSSPSIDEDEIDFQYVYAMRTFVAKEQGQANAYKGDAMVLLNDANSYWWLVRLVKDSSIGFLPAEHIETPWERLARLNKHRNGDLCSGNTAAVAAAAAASKSFGKMFKNKKKPVGKSVSFGAQATYVSASEYEYSDEADDEEEDEEHLEREEEDMESEDEDEHETQRDEVIKPREPARPLVVNKTRELAAEPVHQTEPLQPPKKQQEKKKSGFFGLRSKRSKNQVGGEDLGSIVAAEEAAAAPETPAGNEEENEKTKRRSLLKSKGSVEQIQQRPELSVNTTRPFSPQESIESPSSTSSFSLFKRKKSKEQLSPVDLRSNSSASSRISPVPRDHPAADQEREREREREQHEKERERKREHADSSEKIGKDTNNNIQPIQGLKINTRGPGYSSITESRYPVPAPMRNASGQSDMSAGSGQSIQSENGFQARIPNTPPLNTLQPRQPPRYKPGRPNGQLKRQSVPVALESSPPHKREARRQQKTVKSMSPPIEEWTRESMWNTKRRSDTPGEYYDGADHPIDQRTSMVAPLQYTRARDSPDYYERVMSPPERAREPPQQQQQQQRKQPSRYSRRMSQNIYNMAPSDELKRGAQEDLAREIGQSLNGAPPPQKTELVPLSLPPTDKFHNHSDFSDIDHDDSRDLDELIKSQPVDEHGEQNDPEGRESDNNSDVLVTGERLIAEKRNSTADWVSERQHELKMKYQQQDYQMDKFNGNTNDNTRSYSSQSDSLDSTVTPTSSTANTASTHPTPTTMLNTGSERSHSSNSQSSPPCLDEHENESPVSVSEQEDTTPMLMANAPSDMMAWNRSTSSLSLNHTKVPSESPLRVEYSIANAQAQRLKHNIDADDDDDDVKAQGPIETKSLHKKQEPAETTHTVMMSELHPDIVPIFKDTSDRLGVLSNKLDALLRTYR